MPNLKIIRDLNVVKDLLKKQQGIKSESATTIDENSSFWYLIEGYWVIYWDVDSMSIANDQASRTRIGGSYGLANNYNTVIIICNSGLRNFKKIFDGNIMIIFNRDDPEYNQTDRDGNRLPTTESQKRIIKCLNEYVSRYEPIGTIRW